MPSRVMSCCWRLVSRGGVGVLRLFSGVAGEGEAAGSGRVRPPAAAGGGQGRGGAGDLGRAVAGAGPAAAGAFAGGLVLAVRGVADPPAGSGVGDDLGGGPLDGLAGAQPASGRVEPAGELVQAGGGAGDA